MAFDQKINYGNVLKELIVFEHSSFEDHRGKIWTSYSDDNEFIAEELTPFKHDKFAISYKGTLRGIHYDDSSTKLVSCVSGELQQVVVDMRPDSKTYLLWESFSLSSDKPSSILIPPMFGNAFLVKSEEAVYHYKLSYTGNYKDANDQFTAKWDDPSINISWDFAPTLISQRDR